jgi:hypothetical protein
MNFIVIERSNFDDKHFCSINDVVLSNDVVIVNKDKYVVQKS